MHPDGLLKYALGRPAWKAHGGADLQGVTPPGSDDPMEGLGTGMTLLECSNSRPADCPLISLHLPVVADRLPRGSGEFILGQGSSL